MFRAEVSELGGLGPAKNWLALAILILVLIGIASERIHRMWCAMIGAGLMVSERAREGGSRERKRGRLAAAWAAGCLGRRAGRLIGWAAG